VALRNVAPRDSTVALSGELITPSNVAARADSSAVATIVALTPFSTNAAAALPSRTVTTQPCAIASTALPAPSAVAAAITHWLPTLGSIWRASANGPAEVTAAVSSALSRRLQNSQ